MTLRLCVRNLTVERAGRTVLDDLTFALDPGEAIVVTGANGTGKSTLLGVLAGVIVPAKGSLWVEGGSGAAPEYMHYVGHRDALKPSLTALENLSFWSAMLGDARDTDVRARAALAAFGLAHAVDLPAAYLSAGQKRRLALARLLCADRPIWLLDEPTSALDATAQQRFSERMADHLAAGGMIVAATHAPLGLASSRALKLGAHV